MQPRILYGIDEAGRGPLAGAVVASAAALWGDIEQGLECLTEQNVTDSKKLTQSARSEKIKAWGISLPDLEKGQIACVQLAPRCWMGLSVSENSPARIDQINILKASLEAMQFAFEKLHQNLLQNHFAKDKDVPYSVLVDGPHLPPAWKGKLGPRP